MSAQAGKAAATQRGSAFLCTAALTLCFFALLFLLAGSLLVTALFDYEGTGGIRAKFDNIPANLLYLALSAGAAVLLNRFLEKHPCRISTRAACVSALLAVAVFGTLYVCAVPPVPFADSGMVTRFAESFLNGDYTAIIAPYSYEGYLYMYPYQLCMTAYFELAYRIVGNGNLLGLALCNVFFLVCIDAALLFIADALFHSRRITLTTALLLVFFLPSILFSGYLYGFYPGMAMGIWSAALLIRFLKTGKLLYLPPAVLLMTLSIVVKMNFYIYAVAFGIVLLLNALRTRRAVALLFVPLLVLCPLWVSRLCIRGYEARAGAALGAGYPRGVWLYIGLTDTGLGPGWYGSISYSPEPADHELVVSEVNADIAARTAELAADPVEAASFLFKKTMTMWDEPTFQTLYLSTGGYKSAAVRPPAAEVLTGPAGDAYFHMCRALLPGLYAATLFGVFLLLLRRLPGHAPIEAACLLPIIFFGGFLYHLVSEVKSQFAICYVLMMLPFAAAGVSTFAAGFSDWLNKMRKRSASKGSLAAQ